MAFRGDYFRTLGSAFYALGRIVEAAEIYRRWLSAEPGCAEARHLLAGCGGGPPASDRAPDDYVRATFDRFAPSYDAVVTALGHRSPSLVATALRQALPETGVATPPGRVLDILDAGCGCTNFGRASRYDALAAAVKTR
jgi:predicted TPR repeat methyltransferase